ncbi:hypothetical protein KY290_010693 [Solanum tuberosum]|uniref:Uncharacterized protein n=1 Tax=Solanum tuberosum TaxID=4113 RepID=A0ABQ7VYI8_SOLTU|nr:hypothetical protein KY290_010693 [Solanum tuberosum]
MDYGHVEATFLNRGVCTHSPILIQVNTRPPSRPKPFRLFKTILDHPDFSRILSVVWSGKVAGTRMFQLWSKLKALKMGLKDLNAYMASYTHEIHHARQSLEEQMVLNEIRKCSGVEEHVLKQKSRVNWTVGGEENTKYFHA